MQLVLQTFCGNADIFGLFFCLVTTASPIVMSLPVTDSTSRNTRVGPEGPEFWILPCGYPVTGSDPPESDVTLAENYALQLGVDLTYVNNWKENFVSFL